MQQPSAAVNPAAQIGSIDRRERRREKLLVEMQRTRLRFEKSDKAAQRLLRKIVEQERQLRRLDKAIARAKAEAADALVDSTVIESPPIPLAKLGETAIGKANAESWDAIPAVAKAKPRRQRKPKADVPLTPEQKETARAGRDALMKSMGFRKIGKRKSNPLSAD
jgi:hypothetical protein